ncbi:hypothetical protein V6N13_090936 [Hibiscus sabdariffa]|uniref:Uncharacterized protein n=1 Tax=Hibiscus sabdariffa TaxID=183260 RepID=A0ABR2AJC3_9ROSI
MGRLYHSAGPNVCAHRSQAYSSSTATRSVGPNEGPNLVDRFEGNKGIRWRINNHGEGLLESKWGMYSVVVDLKKEEGVACKLLKFSA